MAETNEKRLKEIKAKLLGGLVNLNISDAVWLLERAEQAAIFEGNSNWFKSRIAELKAHEDILSKENTQLRNALEFYSKEENHVEPVDLQGIDGVKSDLQLTMMQIDKGKKARLSLGK